MARIIALITDFGYADSFVGTMKGVIKRINRDADIIDVTHSVKSFSIPNAQFALYSSYKYFPVGTIFVVVIDPDVGTERKGLIAHDGDYYFVLPDNGILSALTLASLKIYGIDGALFPGASATFHGRDVFAPVAARLSLGHKPEDLGKPINSIVQCPFPEYTTEPNGAAAKVIHIDKFGNAITSLPNDAIGHGPGVYYAVTGDNYAFNVVCARTYGDLSENAFGLIRGSSGFIELAANLISIAERFRMEIGDRIELKKIELFEQ